MLAAALTGIVIVLCMIFSEEIFAMIQEKYDNPEVQSALMLSYCFCVLSALLFSAIGRMIVM